MPIYNVFFIDFNKGKLSFNTAAAAAAREGFRVYFFYEICHEYLHNLIKAINCYQHQPAKLKKPTEIFFRILDLIFCSFVVKKKEKMNTYPRLSELFYLINDIKIFQANKNSSNFFSL